MTLTNPHCAIPNTDDYFVHIRDVMDATSLSRGQIYTMEKIRMFPARIAMSAHRGAWSIKDVTAWMQGCLDRRPPSAYPHCRTLGPGDRFISKKQLLQIAPLGITTITKAEQQALFPNRFQITDGRVAWLESEIYAWLRDTSPSAFQRKFRPRRRLPPPEDEPSTATDLPSFLPERPR